jgi:transposase
MCSGRNGAEIEETLDRGSLPTHLPRIEMMVDIDDHACPCCHGALHRIGEDVSERLDIVPAQFRVLVVGLYAIEGEIRGHSAEERRDARQQRSRPVINELEP